MTRYSRSVIPGRSGGGESLDSQIFGDARPKAANDVAGHVEPRPDFRLLPDEDSGYQPPREGRRAPLLLVGAIVTVGVFGAVVFNAYREGVRPADAEVAPEIASVDSFKSKPVAVEAGSKPAPVQASVFDAIESNAAAPPREVREDPAPPPVAAPTAAPAPPSAAATPPPTPLETAPPPLNVPATPQPAVAPPAAGYKPAFSAGGPFLVQVAAAGTEDAAKAEWDRRARSWPELMQGAEQVIVRADVNGRTVYRARAGAFATAADADAFCTAVKGRGGDCFRTAR